MNRKILSIILKLALAIIPVVIAFVLLISQLPMHYFDKEYAWYRENKEYANKHEQYCRVLIMGDSLAKNNFKPELLSNDAYNFALGGASITEEYYFLKEYLENNEAPKYIIYSTYPTGLLESNTLWLRSVYFHRISKHDLIEQIDINNMLKDEETISKKDEIIDVLCYYLYSPTIYSSAVMNGLISPIRYIDNINKYKQVKENKGQVFFANGDYNNDVARIAEFDCFKPDITLDYYFDKLLELCNDNNIIFILESAPLNEATYDSINDTFVNEYKQYIKQKNSKYSCFIMNADLIKYDSEYFADSTHFNEKGLIMYDKLMKERYFNIFEE